MGILEEVSKMKDRGQTEEEIISNLQDRGINPKAINDALSKSQIKNAVSGISGEEFPNESQGMQPSIMTPRVQELEEENDSPPSPEEEYYSPQENATEEYYPSEQNNPENYYPPQQTPTQEYQEYYPQETNEGYAYNGGVDTDTIIEIAEQVVSNKIKKLEKQIEDLSEIKILAETKLEIVIRRLKRVEEIIDRLQINILEKVGSYGNNIEGIKKEMSMMQDSFRKIINPLADKSEKHHVVHHKTPKKTTHHTTHKKKK